MDAMNVAWRKQATKAVQNDEVYWQQLGTVTLLHEDEPHLDFASSDLDIAWQTNYNRLCQQEFGIGAEYDGEMCTCRAGYINRNNRCTRVSY